MLNFPALRDAATSVGDAERFLWDLEKSDGWDRYWRRQKLALIPDSFQMPVARSYRDRWESRGEQEANQFLLGIADRLERLAIDPSASDDDLVSQARQIASTCRDVLRNASNHLHAAKWLMRVCKRFDVHPPVGLSSYVGQKAMAPSNEGSGYVGHQPRRRSMSPKITDQQTKLVGATFGPTSVGPTEGQHLPMSSIARLTDDAWWRRKLRAIHGRALEAEAIRLHLVHRFAGIYVSDATLKRHQQQRLRNREMLKMLVAVNELDEEIDLDSVAMRSLTNPANRRSELMVRIYGFDVLAEKNGHEAVLLTVTCPSRMHAHSGASGKPSLNHDPSITPREAQSYLTGLWSRIRSKWHRQGIRPYGFRITEPHHDGTPHWHILLFIDAPSRDAMIATVREHALADSPNEPGAAKHRFQVENIDRSKGNATAYVAKYVSKNIDGYGLEPGADGNSPTNQANRVSAWASTWGIHQFDQIGGPPVGLWRELRRAPNVGNGHPLVEALAKAADTADWATFVELLGGPQVSRKELPVSLVKCHDDRPGRYGEPIGERVFGVQAGNVVFTTRLHIWTIQTKRKKGDEALDAAPAEGGEAPAEGPWSSVNNCTGNWMHELGIVGVRIVGVRIVGVRHYGCSGNTSSGTKSLSFQEKACGDMRVSPD